MNGTPGNGASAHAESDLSAFFPGVASLRLGQGEAAGEEGTGGVRGPAEEVGAGRLSATAKLHIERDCRRAIRDGKTRAEACPYPFDTEAGTHWTAYFILAGGKLR